MNLLLAVTLMAIPMALVQGAEKKKLQIGIKKRVDNCSIKSRKGDVLNMHYTVSVILLWPKCYSPPNISYLNCLFFMCRGNWRTGQNLTAVYRGISPSPSLLARDRSSRAGIRVCWGEQQYFCISRSSEIISQSGLGFKEMNLRVSLIKRNWQIRFKRQCATVVHILACVGAMA